MRGQGAGERSFVAAAQAMHETLVAWRAEHPAASFDEIAEGVRKGAVAMLALRCALLSERWLPIKAAGTLT